MKLTLTADEAREIVWEESDKYETVEDKAVGKRRWTDIHDLVFREKATGLLYRIQYDVGSTEQQEERPFEYVNSVDAEAVKAVEKIITVYEAA